MRFVNDANDDIRIEGGDARDLALLRGAHYRTLPPGNIDSVYRLVRRGRSVVGRFLGRRDGPEVIGAVVLSWPPLASAMRDRIVPDLFAGLDRRGKARIVNERFRTISRVVIDPRWRGLGFATILVRHALERTEVPFVEAFASMGRVNPFFERAGMMMYEPAATVADERLNAALEVAGFDDVQRRREVLRWFAQTMPVRWKRVVDPEAPLERLLARVDAIRRGRPLYYLWSRGGEGMTENSTPRGVRVRTPDDVLDLPQPLTFFLPPDERSRILRALRGIDADRNRALSLLLECRQGNDA